MGASRFVHRFNGGIGLERIAKQANLRAQSHGFVNAFLRAQVSLECAGFIGVCETLQNARDARALLEQALDAARFR